MIPTNDFFTWLATQSELRSVRGHVHHFVAENDLHPTSHELKSLKGGIYNRLRKSGGRDYQNVDYQPRDTVERDEDEPVIQLSESRDLTVIHDAIQQNGFALPDTTNALTATQITHVNATKGQQKSVGALVQAFTAELAIKDVKLSNEAELARRDRESAVDLRASLEESRRDKAFLQSLLANGKRGNSVV